MFDYTPIFEDRYGLKTATESIGKEGEWYMYIDREFIAVGNGTVTITTINIGKNIAGRGIDIRDVIKIALLPVPDDGVCIPSSGFAQNLDVSKCFLNLSNEYYLKSDIQLLDQLMNGEITLKQNNCADKKMVLADTLYIPDYIFLKSSMCGKKFEFVDSKEYMEGYNSPYVVLTNEEMIKLFKAGKPFYYLLFGTSGERKNHFIVEGLSGKLMEISSCGGYNIGKEEMEKIYKSLSDTKKCE